jgi:4'-phosphopantetheinyl transferase
MMEIYGVNLNRLLRADEFERLMRLVSEQRRAKVKRFMKPEDANRGLVAEALIRSIIRNKYRISNDRIVLAENEYGKPYAAGIPSFHFNLSHSGRWIVCAVDSAPVGIDIEEIKPIEFELAKLMFSLEEYRYLTANDEHERMPCLYDLWTMKESFAKWEGRGLSLPPQCYSIYMEANRNPSVTMEGRNMNCFFKRWSIDPGYKMAVCSTASAFPGQMIFNTVEELSGQ